MVKIKWGIIKQLYEGDEMDQLIESPKAKYTSFERDNIMSVGNVRMKNQKSKRNKILTNIKKQLAWMNSTFNDKPKRNISYVLHGSKDKIYKSFESTVESTQKYLAL